MVQALAAPEVVQEERDDRGVDARARELGSTVMSDQAFRIWLEGQEVKAPKPAAKKVKWCMSDPCFVATMVNGKGLCTVRPIGNLWYREVVTYLRSLREYVCYLHNLVQVIGRSGRVLNGGIIFRDGFAFDGVRVDRRRFYLIVFVIGSMKSFFYARNFAFAFSCHKRAAVELRVANKLLFATTSLLVRR